MAEKDLFDDLCDFYEFMLGPLPKREEFKRTLQDTVANEELAVFFLLPSSGSITFEALRIESAKASIPAQDLVARLTRLASEGFILAYETPEGLTYERGNPVFMTEQQVRKPEDNPRRTFYAGFFNTLLDGSTSLVPTKTPYYRVLPVEATLKQDSKARLVPVNTVIPDPRGVLPIDIISEIIRQETTLIGVAECYCRKTKRIVGEGCEHPLETCFVFNELAQTLINNGFARKVEYDEAMEIMWQCEEAGLVHNVDNCQEEIRSLCNCCSCCCAVLKNWERGYTNAGAPSRYTIAFDADRCNLCETCISICPTHARVIRDERIAIDAAGCIGCGLCVAACPQGANRMVPREKIAEIPRTNTDLYSQIGTEAGAARNKLLGN